MYAEDQAGRHVRCPAPKVQRGQRHRRRRRHGGGAGRVASPMADPWPELRAEGRRAPARWPARRRRPSTPGMSWENVDYILDNTGMSKKA